MEASHEDDEQYRRQAADDSDDQSVAGGTCERTDCTWQLMMVDW